MQQDDGLVAVRACVNNNYLSLDKNNTIIASNANVQGMQQKYEIYFSFFDENIIGLKSADNRKYLMVQDKMKEPVIAVGKKFWKNSMFKIKKFEA